MKFYGSDIKPMQFLIAYAVVCMRDAWSLAGGSVQSFDARFRQPDVQRRLGDALAGVRGAIRKLTRARTGSQIGDPVYDRHLSDALDGVECRLKEAESEIEVLLTAECPNPSPAVHYEMGKTAARYAALALR